MSTFIKDKYKKLQCMYALHTYPGNRSNLSLQFSSELQDYSPHKSKESDESCQMVPMIKVITETGISFKIHKRDKSGKKCHL